MQVRSVEFPNFLAYRPNGRVMVNNVNQNSGSLVVCDPRGAEHARVLILSTSGQPRVAETLPGGAQPVCPAG